MRRVLTLAALVLLVAGLLAPGLEAFAGCAEACPDDDDAGRCADGLCCSCCTFAAPATVRPQVAPWPGMAASERIPHAITTLPAGEGRGVLHVPKTTLS
jgi:hypothetical protein